MSNEKTQDVFVEKEKEDLDVETALRLEHANHALADDLSVWQTLRVFWKASAICLLAEIGALSDGYQFSVPGSIIANEGFIQQFGKVGATGTYALDPKHVAAWGGIYTGAYIFILLFGSFPSNYFGRKPVLLAVQLLLAAACLVEMFAKGWGVWSISKVLQGFAIGLNQGTATAYVSEIAPTNARGALLGTYQLFFALGQFSGSIGLQVLQLTTPLKWRKVIYSEWVFFGLATIAWFLIPESPRWHATKGREEKSKAILRRLNGHVKGYDVDAEYLVLRREVEDGAVLASQSKKLSILNAFRGTNLRRTFISFWPFAFQTWVGNTIVFGYTAYFFQLAGIKKVFTAVVAIYVILVVFIALSSYIVERVGRRPLLLTGGGICVCCMAVIGGLSFAPASGPAGSALVAFACIWVAAYAVSIGPLGYIYLAETSTIMLRNQTTTLAAAGTGCLNLISNYCTPLMLAATNFGIKGSSFFYFGTGVFGWLLVYFFVPETRGRNFVELDELFERRISARKFAETETQVDIAKREGQIQA